MFKRSTVLLRRAIATQSRTVTKGSTATVLAFLAGAAATYAVSAATADTSVPPRNAKSTTPLEEVKLTAYASPVAFQTAIKEIATAIGTDKVSYDRDDILGHSDSSYSMHHPANDSQHSLAVVYPTSTEDVSKILSIANKYKVPVVPYSGGTSLEGHYIPTKQGISLDVSRMSAVLSFNPDDLDITVQPGIDWQQLNEYVSESGLLWGPDPGPGAQIGGLIGTNASGTNASRYGTMKDNVLSLVVVLADGTVVRTRRRPKKSSAGYNLTSLFVGSEGTLGIVTEATLKLHVKSEEETVAVVNFNTIKEATSLVSDIVAKGIQVNAVELLDDNLMHCVNFGGQTSRTWLEKPTLFIKLGGNNKTVLQELVNDVQVMAKKNGSLSFEFARDEEEKEELWSARRAAFWSTKDLSHRLYGEKGKVYITDVIVPISKLPQVIADTQKDILDNNLKATILGHVGDGNFHALITYDDEREAVTNEVVHRLINRALENEGSCTGEHGVGVGKRDFLVQEVGSNAVDLMRHIKISMDPNMILNPDKVFRLEENDGCDHH